MEMQYVARTWPFSPFFFLSFYCLLQKAAIKKMDMQASKEFLAELKVLTHVHHLNLVWHFPNLDTTQNLKLDTNTDTRHRHVDTNNLWKWKWLNFNHMCQCQTYMLLTKMMIPCIHILKYMLLIISKMMIPCIHIFYAGAANWILCRGLFIFGLWVHWEWQFKSTFAWHRLTIMIITRLRMLLASF